MTDDNLRRRSVILLSCTKSHYTLSLKLPYKAPKRILDIVGAVVILALTVPVLIIIACLVRFDGGPVFYSQPRIGRGGRPFAILKFRSMVTDGVSVLEHHLAADPALAAEWAARRKLTKDPRVTRLGRFLRATSLDELPQLLNVLIGEMSLVGPRPVTAEELEHYYGQTGREAYISVRPGITGLWQISGRNNTSYAERVALDCAYAEKPSLGKDLRILFRTASAVVRREGAY